MVLIPITPKLRGRNTVHLQPLRLGPLCARPDGGLAAVYESWTLRQWGPDLTQIEPHAWTDSNNSDEDIRSITPFGNSVCAGTDSGLAAIVSPHGSATVIDQLDSDTLPFDARKGILSSTTNAPHSIVFIGTREGEIKRLDPTGNRQSLPFTVAGHRDGITAMACDLDAQLFVSGDAKGVLKFWTNNSTGLDLHFELRRNSRPIVSLKLTEDGNHLYVLREGERGLRRLDIRTLNDMFESLGLEPWAHQESRSIFKKQNR